MSQQSAVSDRRINLAHAPPFRLGGIEVIPATRQIRRGRDVKTLEPRVMQVLVALAEARGEVVSRDDLIERCWNGQVVGENAINRVISRIRGLAAELGMDSLQLETITKVGYRLLVDGPAPAEASPTSPPVPSPPVSGPAPAVGRRLVLSGAAALLGAGALGYGLWRKDAPDAERAKAVDLVRRAREIGTLALTGSGAQSLDYLREAVRTDPGCAEAWGLLALAYRHYGPEGDLSDPNSGKAKSVAAANRALELDPGNADARAALVLVPSCYRNWARIEAGLRRILEQHPRHVVSRFYLGMLMSEVGRWHESIRQLQEVNRLDPFRPVAHYRLAHALWSVGRVEEAENTVDRAMERWPRHGAIWETKFRLLLFSGRPDAAASFAVDMSARPPDYPPQTGIADRLAVARALATRARSDIEAAAAQTLDRLRLAPDALSGIPYLSALGRLDDAFEVADGYYFGRGRWAGDSPPGDDRGTVPLFYPPVAAMRADPRFATLVRGIGLEGYWRATSTAPDYRL